MTRLYFYSSELIASEKQSRFLGVRLIDIRSTYYTFSTHARSSVMYQAVR